MESFFEKLKDLINELYIPDCFANDDRYLFPLAEEFRKYFPDSYYSTGATKAVFIIPGVDYVVKIPFNGSIIDEYDDFFMEDLEQADGAEIDLGEGQYFIPFVRASEFYGSNAENCWNYCANELGYYKDAVNDGYGDFFAETAFYGYSKGGFPIYIQEKVTPVTEGDEREPSNNSYKEALNFERFSLNDLDLDSPIWLANAFDFYSKDRVEDFIDYLSTCCVNDLHEGNIGYTKDNRPVLLDWSGFNEEIEF
jgi:hypothetical protein